MKKIGHKLLTTIMTLTFLSAMTVPAFAETTTTPPSQVEKSDKVKLTPQEVKDRLNAKIQKIQDNRENTGPLMELRTQEKEIRSKLHKARETTRQGLKAVKEAKDKDTLLQALESLVKVQDDVILVKGTATTLKTDHAQLKTDREAKNSEAIAADLVKIEADLKLLIQQQNQVLVDLNATNAILSQSTSGGTAPASETVQ